MAIRHRHPWRAPIGALAASFLIASCGDAETTVDFEAAAKARIETFQNQLQSELRAALEAGGPVNAVKVCSEKAPMIAQQASGEGLRIRRIGTRVRNPANAPTEADQAILDEFAALPAEERDGATRVVERNGDQVLYAPIWLQNPLCLGCHGEPERIDAKVLEAIRTNYPEDQAKGYQIGDLRGAFVVEEVP